MRVIKWVALREYRFGETPNQYARRVRYPEKGLVGEWE
jgi:hypothetical protein